METLTTFFNDLVLSNEINTQTSIFRIVLSLVLGIVIGTERQINRHNAGLRTFILICVGSTIAMLVSIYVPQIYPHFLNGDPGRIAAQVITGVGFLGAGAIIQRGKGDVQGLTTAACIWLAAAIGLAVGAGLYIVSIVVTIITLIILVVFDIFEYRIFERGTHKRLIVRSATASPDIERLKSILCKAGIFVRDTTFYSDFNKQTTNITFSIYLKNSIRLEKVCDDLRAEQSVYAVGIVE